MSSDEAQLQVQAYMRWPDQAYMPTTHLTGRVDFDQFLLDFVQLRLVAASHGPFNALTLNVVKSATTSTVKTASECLLLKQQLLLLLTW